MSDTKTLAPIAFIKLDMGGIEGDGLFMSCTLPGGSINQAETKVYDPNGGNSGIHAPAHLTWSDVSLVRGIDDKLSCYEWFMKLAEEGPEGNTKDVKIELLDQKQQTIMVWSMTSAWISSYQASASEAGGQGIATEALSLSFVTAKREQ